MWTSSTCKSNTCVPDTPTSTDCTTDGDCNPEFYCGTDGDCHHDIDENSCEEDVDCSGNT
jgi:hypothetical protein